MAGTERENVPATEDEPTGPEVPTRDQLRARWTCHCEQLGMVRPKVPGSHTAAAVLCSRRERAGTGAEFRIGDVMELLVAAMRVSHADAPKGVHKLWRALLENRAQPGHITWSMCLKARSTANPAWAVAGDDQQRDTSVPKTLLIGSPWECWALRSPHVVGTWGGWSGTEAKPEQFYVIRNGVREVITFTEAMKYVKDLHKN